ncbi:hypothetical protein GGTG_04996 [Gaeumannomyces tritici R3-111a-1]|uniref:Zn(2)-C6 fungal-type domain-containing protein n=1 Tax=Gaeumannomyces tritici (strain R3-111a-1) TaxID=644352 RepID=J3NUP0_GAET3|nr:hypothetical protein GGTG_04996 [Gaeumannomyces tritici R3-111a-1]EJT79914.1 hypothetical protein GGTG_04996 [Gaeumannomyces tritici R3-111a-1]
MDAMDTIDDDAGRADRTALTSPSPKHSAESSTTPSVGGGYGKHPALSPAAAAAAAASAAQPKRKRGPGIVTPNACNECRKKRAKCDGLRPCSRCKAQKGVECVYEVPLRQSKEDLRAEIDQLRRQQQNNESILSALAEPSRWEEVLQRLRSGHSVESISEWLGGTLPSGGGAMAALPRRGPGPVPSASSGNINIAPRPPRLETTAASAPSQPSSGLRHELDQNSPWGDPLSLQPGMGESRHTDNTTWRDENRGSFSRVNTWVETMQQQQQQPQQTHYRQFEPVMAHDVPQVKIPVETWTSLTPDISLVQHLLSLYFCWEYPTFASLSKEHFISDFQQGRPRFCSSILVNALMALGCRFSSQPNTRANPDDPYSSGDHFFKECQRLLYEETSHHTLTTIQALGIMSIREASCGRDSESWFYAGQSIKLAIEMGLHKIQDVGGDEDELAVQAATFWGAFALDHAWSLATGSLPQSSSFIKLPPKPNIIDDIEASLWIPYTDDGTPLQQSSCEQPSNVRSVYKCFCELSELVHQSLYALHSPGKPLAARELLALYTSYLHWYANIPEVLRLGANFTPSVLFAHMYYHFAILLLFRPLIKLRIIGSSVSPRDVCLQAAEAISSLLRSYSQLYTLRRTPSFVPYFVLTSSIMHLAIAATRAQESSAPAAGTGGAGAAAVTGQDSAGDLAQPPENITTEAAVSAARSDPQVVRSINQGIADLTEMAPCHHFAEQALNILRHLAKKWKIEVNIGFHTNRMRQGERASNDEKQLQRQREEQQRAQGQPQGQEQGREQQQQQEEQQQAQDPQEPRDPAQLLRQQQEALEEQLQKQQDDLDAEHSVRPVTSSLNFFAPNVSDHDFVCSWGGDQPAGQASSSSDAVPAAPSAPGMTGTMPVAGSDMNHVVAATSTGRMANPLFWPFPMQGKPMLPTGKALLEAGFELL